MSDVRFRSISCEQLERSSANFIYALVLTKSTLGNYYASFLALDWCQYLVSAQYFDNKWRECHQILYV